MSQIDTLLNQAIWLLHNEQVTSSVEYVSRIDGENTAWYFWLKNMCGVFELKLVELSRENENEKSCFALKYYPNSEEEVFESFATVEKLVRLGALFDDSKIIIHEEEHELCPCCGGNHSEHEHVVKNSSKSTVEQGVLVKGSTLVQQVATNILREKGIPKLLERSKLHPTLFLIGQLNFRIGAEGLKAVRLSTQSQLIQYADDGFNIIDENGQQIELVAKGEIERAIPSLKLCQAFYGFLIEEMLGILSINPIDKAIKEDAGTVVHKSRDGKWFESPDNGVKKVEMQSIY
ncbi:MAG: hypothetical protein RSE47_01430 [Acidaminococcaceae bacterium]